MTHTRDSVCFGNLAILYIVKIYFIYTLFIFRLQLVAILEFYSGLFRNRPQSSSFRCVFFLSGVFLIVDRNNNSIRFKIWETDIHWLMDYDQRCIIIILFRSQMVEYEIRR